MGIIIIFLILFIYLFCLLFLNLLGSNSVFYNCCYCTSFVQLLFFLYHIIVFICIVTKNKNKLCLIK